MKTNQEGLTLIATFMDEYDVAESRTAAERAVNLFVKASINPNQFSALVCLVMRIGIDEFRVSKILKLINQSIRNRELLLRAADEFDRYIYAENDDGKRVADPFMSGQSILERALYLKPAVLPKRKR